MTNENKCVVYVGPYSFPIGGAAARRIYGNCVSLKKLGYDVIVTTGQVTKDDGETDYNGIPVVSLNERRHENLPRFLKHILYFSAGKRTIDWLSKLKDKPDAIILYSGYSPYLIRLIPWARKNNVKLIFDTVEWYDPPNFISKIISPYYLNIEFAMRCLLKKCDGLIVISNYLNNYYTGSVLNIVQIPPTVDCDSIEVRKHQHEGDLVRFVYAGTPGKKDALSSIVEAVLIAASMGQKVELNLAGIQEADLHKYVPVSSLDNIKTCINCHGLLDHQSAIKLVRSCDYSIIIRPNIRSVQAGFPTKFVESMAVGTPVIANLTSDLGDYLQDGFNGYVCADSSVKSLADVIRKCSDSKNVGAMRVHARETAEKYFDSLIYTSQFKSLIER